MKAYQEKDTHKSLCYHLYGVEYQEQFSQLCHISENLKERICTKQERVIQTKHTSIQAFI